MLRRLLLRSGIWVLTSFVTYALSMSLWSSRNFIEGYFIRAQRRDADRVFMLCHLAIQNVSFMRFFQAIRPAGRVLWGSITGKRTPSQEENWTAPDPDPEPQHDQPFHFDYQAPQYHPQPPQDPCQNPTHFAHSQAHTPAYNQSVNQPQGPMPPAPTSHLGLGARLEAIGFDEDDEKKLPKGDPETERVRSYFDFHTFELMEDPVKAYYRWPHENFDRFFICDRSSYIMLWNTTGQHPENDQPFIRVESAPDIKAQIIAFVKQEEQKIANGDASTPKP